MSSLIGVKESIALLHRLKSTIKEVAAKAQAISQGGQAFRAAESKAHQAAIQKHSADLATRLAAAESEVRVRRESMQRRFETRQKRIARAYSSSRDQALRQIEARDSRQKYLLQKQALDASRQNESDLASASARLDRFQRATAESQAQFADLELNARRTFRAAGEFRKLLQSGTSSTGQEVPADEDAMLTELGQIQIATAEALDLVRRNRILGLFRGAPLWVWITLLVLGYLTALVGLPYYGLPTVSPSQATAGFVAAALGVVALYWVGKRLTRPAARLVARNLDQAHHWHELGRTKAEQRHHQDQTRIKEDREKLAQQIDDQWHQTLEEASQARLGQQAAIDEQHQRLLRRSTQQHQSSVEALDQAHSIRLLELRRVSQSNQDELEMAQQARLKEGEKEFVRRWQTIQEEWERLVEPVLAEIRAASTTAQELFPSWDDSAWEKWTAPSQFGHAVPFGHVQVNVEALVEEPLPDKLLALVGTRSFSLPLLLQYPRQGSLLFETSGPGQEEAIGAMNSVVFRLLAACPPGKVNFDILDPIGLGQSFAGLMHLADYEENQINNRIWTQAEQFEERLAALNEHMEKVIQMYLRNDYPTIAEYNAQAGIAAEKFHVLVVAGFPVNFSETAARRLLNIAANGPRCGVYLLIAWDLRHAAPHDFVPNELRQHGARLIRTETGFTVPGTDLKGLDFRLDPPPSPEFATRFLRQVGRNARDSNRVELPFSQVAPRPEDQWSLESSLELRVPIGRSGATKLQELALGKGTRQHCLVAGKTGSGKSTLFHVLITNLALWYSPDQVEFYLVDFKKGVEFKCYATWRLPHARVIAIESDREFGLSVLQRVDEELRRRGDLFRQAHTQDLSGYIKSKPDRPMPRLLLLIDEFQEFFTEEDRIAQAAAVVLDRIVRQGRAFGIHVLLGSQTLGGAYSLARATINQMVIRIALQCNEADAYLIMDENNSAPRLLSRPGEGIYNDMAGAREGNSPFQVVWLPETVRDAALQHVRALADRGPTANLTPTIFEGNAPAEIAENGLLREALAASPARRPAIPRAWIGAPNSIKGPTEIPFRQQSGSHLLIIGQAEEAALNIVAASLVSLGAQLPSNGARFILVHPFSPGTPEREFLDRAAAVVPQPVTHPSRQEIAPVLRSLAEELDRGGSGESVEEPNRTFLVIVGLQEFKFLKQEDDFSFATDASDQPIPPAACLLRMITEGASLGIHVIASIDTYNNALKFLGRKALNEVGQRVLFQMSPTDSASLIDSPEASKLGLHRALLYDDREGQIEKFRPYARPGNSWLETAAHLTQRRSSR